MGNCVVTEPSCAVASGSSSIAGALQMTTPAACTEACLGSPSSERLYDISCATSGSSSTALFRSGFIVSALSRVIPSSLGIILAIWSPLAYERFIALATSRITPRAASVPKVMICTTLSLPYFSVT